MAGDRGRPRGAHPVCGGGGGEGGGRDHAQQQAVLRGSGPGRTRRQASAGPEEGGEGEDPLPTHQNPESSAGFSTDLLLLLLQGERSFFLQPGEHLENGIQNVYVLSEEEGLVLRAVEAFHDEEVRRQAPPLLIQ